MKVSKIVELLQHYIATTGVKPGDVGRAADLDTKQPSTAINRLLDGTNTEYIPIRLVDFILENTVLSGNKVERVLGEMKADGLDDEQLESLGEMIEKMKGGSQIAIVKRIKSSAAKVESIEEMPDGFVLPPGAIFIKDGKFQQVPTKEVTPGGASIIGEKPTTSASSQTPPPTPAEPDDQSLELIARLLPRLEGWEKDASRLVRGTVTTERANTTGGKLSAQISDEVQRLRAVLEKSPRRSSPRASKSKKGPGGKPSRRGAKT